LRGKHCGRISGTQRVIPDAKQEIAVALSQKANDVADERRQPVRFLRIHA